jgi:antitoxin (DNA-binding transcriptional repressor) of toxin-antitoxin stability system
MKFISVRDLRFRASAIRKDLQEQQDLILTANGRPFAILSPVRPDNLEEQLLAMRRARARMAVDRLRDGARARGKDRMSAKRIQALISKVRVERRSSASE